MKPLILAALIDATSGGHAAPMLDHMETILESRGYQVVSEEKANVFVIVSAEGNTYFASVSARDSLDVRPAYIGQWAATCDEAMTDRLCGLAAAANAIELIEFEEKV